MPLGLTVYTTRSDRLHHSVWPSIPLGLTAYITWSTSAAASPATPVIRLVMSFRGRGWCLLTARRLKSFKCLALVAVVMNLLLFASLAWKSMPRTVSSEDLPAGRLGDHAHEGQTHLLVESFKQKAASEAGKKVLSGDAGRPPSKPQLGAVTADSPKRGAETGRQRTACSVRTAVYLNDKHLQLNQPPFADYVKAMSCTQDGHIAIFGDKFVRFNNALVDASKTVSTRKGGEKMEEVWNQREEDEYFKLTAGYFKAPCLDKPALTFSHVDHLSEWARALECYRPNQTDLSHVPVISGTTLAIQRYEYVNLYHTMTDFYNAFVLMLVFGVPPSRLNILAVDAHPEGTLDPVWFVLFGKFIRVGRLPQPTVFEDLVWGLLGYFSPLNEHERTSVPYLDEFREFFLGQHNISTDHVIDCARLNVLLIWRHDYVAHPRNPKGSVVRKFDNEDEMVQEVKDTLGAGATVRGMQLDTMMMTDQLQAVSKADILVGMHGAGLSHILFLPATSGVIEFKPEYSNPALQHFKSMAAWRHLPYTIWHNYDAANEKAAHRTYIPRSVVRKTIMDIQSQICPTGRS